MPPKPAKPLRAVLYDEGGNILALQKILGHADITLTMRYSHLSPDFLAGEVARLDFSAPPPAGVADMAGPRRQRAAATPSEQ